jgi:hypothetical protein
MLSASVSVKVTLGAATLVKVAKSVVGVIPVMAAPHVILKFPLPAAVIALTRNPEMVITSLWSGVASAS